MSEWRHGDVTVRWVDGGLYVESGGVGLVIDAPAGIAPRLGDRVRRVGGVVLTGDPIRSVGGLVPLLAALEPHRLSDVPLPLHFPLGAERGAMLAESWVRGWSGRFPITLDGEAVGTTFGQGRFQLTSIGLRSGEPVWREQRVEPILCVALRIEVDGVTIVWVPSAAPDRRVARACSEADLAIVEVGVIPWPSTPDRWRLSVSEAVALAEGARMVWVVGDDGHLSPGLHA